MKGHYIQHTISLPTAIYSINMNDSFLTEIHAIFLLNFIDYLLACDARIHYTVFITYNIYNFYFIISDIEQH